MLRRHGQAGLGAEAPRDRRVRGEPAAHGGGDRHVGAPAVLDDEERRENGDDEGHGREPDGGQLRVVEEPPGGIARRAVHRARRLRLGDEGDRRADVHEQLEDDDVDRVERGGQPEHQRHGDDHDQSQLGAEVEGDRAPQLRGERATALDGLHDRRVGVVDEHEVGRLAGEVGAARAHGDADVGAGEGRRVVDAVAGDGDRLVALLEDPDEAQLVLGGGARDDGLAAQAPGELVVAEGVERRRRRA